LTTWDPYSYAGDQGAALGSPGTTKEVAGPGSPGLGPGLPMAQALAVSFVVAGDVKGAPRSPAYEYGSQVANLENLSVEDFRNRIT